MDDLPQLRSGRSLAGEPLRRSPLPPYSPSRSAHSDASAPSSSGPESSDLHRYWQVIRARWRVVVGTLTLVVAAVAVGLLIQTPVYVARGMIEIRKQSAEVVPVEALFQSERLSTQYLETQYGVLRSPALARQVVAALRLTEVEEFNPALEADPASGSAAVDSAAVLAGVVERFRERLVVDPTTGSHLIRVQFESEDPELAARVVNTVFQVYAGMRAAAGRAAVVHLAKQVDSARERLGRAERRLQEFLRANELMVVAHGSGETGEIPYERLRQLQQQLTAAEVDRYAREAEFRLLEEDGEEYLTSDVLRSLSVRAAELRGEYAKLRSTFTDEYPRTRQVRTQLSELEAQLDAERNRVRGEITGSYAAAVRRHSLLEASFRAQMALLDRLAERYTEYQLVEREVEAHKQLYAVLQQRLREAEVSAALAGTEVEVVDPAVPPLLPARPQPGRDLKLALVAGLVLGLGLAFLLEYGDPTIRSIEEVDALAVPLLAAIPSASPSSLPVVTRLGADNARWLRLLPPGGERPAQSASWFRIDQPDSTDATLIEAFGSLRTSVLLDSTGHAARSLLLTSAQPGDGKTTVSVNLALSLAKLGKHVLLVDADVRRPSVYRVLETGLSPGLVDFLAGSAEWRSLVRSEVAPGLDVLTSGAPPGTPTELLSLDRMRALVAEAGSTYDFVLFDSPALFLHAADSRVLAPLMDGVIVVIRSGVTPRDVVQRVLRQVPNLVGVVLNDVDALRFPAYYRTYGRAVAPG